MMESELSALRLSLLLPGSGLGERQDGEEEQQKQLLLLLLMLPPKKKKGREGEART